jgi:hypothetical protein
MTSLVYIWIGKKLPSWAQLSLRLANRTSGLDVILLCNRSVGKVKGIPRQYYLEDFYIQPLAINTLKDNRAYFRAGFWIKTIERFFVLQQFLNTYQAGNIFHAELDNIVFNLSELGKKLDFEGSGLFCPRDSPDRGIASLIYINDHSSLVEFNNLALDKLETNCNDMDLLGILLSSSTRFYSLATEANFNLNTKSLPWRYIPEKAAGGIFDAAAIGQFLFGIDPRNCNWILYNGFENENKGCDLWSLKYQIDIKNGLASVGREDGSDFVNLYNIHIHSKLFKQTLRDGRISKILNKIHNKKKTLMSFNLSLNNLYYQFLEFKKWI